MIGVLDGVQWLATLAAGGLLGWAARGWLHQPRREPARDVDQAHRHRHALHRACRSTPWRT